MSVQAFPKERNESIKEIYVYPLDKNFRVKLGLPKDSGAEAIDIASGLDEDHWAENEFGNASSGDKRLSNRLIEIAKDKVGDPSRSYCGVAEGD